MDCRHDLVLWQSWSTISTPARARTARRRSVLQLPPLGSSSALALAAGVALEGGVADVVALIGGVAGVVEGTLGGTVLERKASWPTVPGGAGAMPCGRLDLPPELAGWLDSSIKRRCTKFGLGAAGAAAFAIGAVLARRP